MYVCGIGAIRIDSRRTNIISALSSVDQSAGFRFRRSWVQIPQGGPKIRKFQLSDFLFASQIYHHIKGKKKNADLRNNSNRTPDAPRNDA